MIPIIARSKTFANRTAIIDKDGSYSYATLMDQALSIAVKIVGLQIAAKPVLFLIPSGFNYVAIQWGVWLAGKIAVPVHIAHTVSEIEYLLEDTGSGLLIYDDILKDKAEACSASNNICISLTALLNTTNIDTELPGITQEDDCMMIYTSGTTGKPKGVVMTHGQLDKQMQSLSKAWEWGAGDRILNVLPMHHVHGVINITCCTLYNGATLEMQSSFDPGFVCSRMASGELTLFMAVPTIYHKLIQHFEQLPENEQRRWQQGMSQMRLMVSGSAALPVTVLEKWKQISGHVLLERYGMTEIGMALSNPLHDERRPGYVGKPLPFVSVKIVDEKGSEILDNNVPGALYVKGETVFKRYWNRPEETAKSFEYGWFKTGDVAECDADGYYKILGRNSSDIIKSGGYKISALEIENVLLEHNDVQECAVVALPSEEWGETIAAAIVGNIDHTLLKNWLKDRLAPYKIPRQFVEIDVLPRNAMGKVLKVEVKKMF
jgi:malonyl-CoA/methylmalonyl-CoA synthetase